MASLMEILEEDSDQNERFVELREEWKSEGLEDLYVKYVKNIYRNYLNSFCIVHLIFVIIHCSIICNTETINMPVDIPLYLGGAVFTVISLRPYMRVNFEYEHPKVKYIVSWAAVLIMTATDLIYTTFHVIRHDAFLRSAYAAYVISVVYLFMPLPGIRNPLLLGTFVSSLYCINLFYVVVVNDQHHEGVDIEMDLLIPDVLFVIGLNIVCLFLRKARERATRSNFFTKHQSIRKTLLWQHAKDREKSVLIRIIPEQIAIYIGKEIRSRIENESNKKSRRTSTRQLFVETHDDVTILFADVVNYTHLTTKLNIKTLVDTLNQLFQKFDAACKMFSVTRIKFLGDCYYAVSGMPISHPLHAVCCTELGLATIEYIREVKAIRNMNIDMRVGIHSGSVLAGIVGSSKWQYDVWSKDVDIANHLEMTGVPGRVHISNTTLNLLDDFYDYEPGTQRAKGDRALQKYNVTSYLIIKKSKKMINSREWKMYLESKQESAVRQEEITKTIVYSEIVRKSNEMMRREIPNLPICKHNWITSFFTRPQRLLGEQKEEYKANQSISKYLLLFRTWKWEYQQIELATHNLIQSTSALSLYILIVIIMIQSQNKVIQDVQAYVVIMSSIFLYNVITVAVLWRKELAALAFPCASIRKFFKPYMIRIHMTPFKIFILNYVIYATSVTSLLICSLVHMIICDNTALENDINNIFKLLEEGIRTLCFNAWAVTNCVILYIIMALLWPYVPFPLKLLQTLPVIITYVILIYSSVSLEFESSAITNVGVTAEFSHIWIIVTTLIIHLFMCRHLVFLRKYNYIAMRQLKSKIEHFRLTNESITALLYNVLPTHIVQRYLDKVDDTEQLYELHNNVAIIFATVIHNSEHTMVLPVMNDILCDFDEILSFYREPINVEKIKVINWTYMAACGFSVAKSERTSKKYGTDSIFIPQLETSSLRGRITPFHQRYSETSHTQDNESKKDTDEESIDEAIESRKKKIRTIVYVMTNFACDLLKIVNSMNERLMKNYYTTDESSLKLRVGISYGEVMAGIVGSSHPHYDIWGNAVNMASRMDTTGIPNRIQITEDVAKILRTYNIECSLRGLTHVKGVGEIPTYFVETDASHDFKYMDT